MTTTTQVSKKLATGTLPFIVKAIRQFWASDSYGVDRDTLRITHPTKDMNERFRVVKVTGGFAFEHYATRDVAIR